MNLAYDNFKYMCSSYYEHRIISNEEYNNYEDGLIILYSTLIRECYFAVDNSCRCGEVNAMADYIV